MNAEGTASVNATLQSLTNPAQAPAAPLVPAVCACNRWSYWSRLCSEDVIPCVAPVIGPVTADEARDGALCRALQRLEVDMAAERYGVS